MGIGYVSTVPRVPPPLMTKNPVWAVVATTMALVLIPINSTMIAVGLAPIAHGLAVPVSSVVWAITAYLVVMAALQPVSGKVGDLVGHRRLLFTGLGIFLVSSVLAALSPHLWALITFRSGQALGGALVAPNAMAIVRSLYERNALRKVLGTVSMIQGLGAAIGPLLGILLIHFGGWPAMFWINIPVILLATLFAAIYIPRDTVRIHHHIDYGGALTLALFLALLSLSVPRTHLAHAWILTVPLALAVFGVFVWVEQRVQDPVVRFPLFHSAPFRSANLSILLSNFFMYSTLLFMPIYLKEHHDGTALTGALLFVFSCSMSLMSYLGGILTRRLGGPRVVLATFLVNLLVVLWYIGLLRPEGLLYLAGGLFIAGAGSGMGNVAFQATVLEAAPRTMAGVASGIYSTFRYIGSITASALIGLMVIHQGLHWGILVLVAGLGIWLSRGFPRQAGHITPKDSSEASG